MTHILSAKNIIKRYSGHTALNDVSIDIPEGSVYGLLGPNGAGKTTFIRIINRITGPDEGEVFFMGQRLRSAHTSQIGYLPEERGLYKKMKVGEQALYLATLKGMKQSDALKSLKHWFEKFGIEKWWDKNVEELSKGMQQKVQFIVTIIHKPRLLIFDEPFSGFDPINANLLKNEILNLREEGATVIFSTHNMSSVEELCDSIALINQSQVVLEGKVRDIKESYKTNLFEAEMIHYKNNLPFPEGMKLISEEKEVNITRLKLGLSQGISSNDCISLLLEHGELRKFHEVLPSMDDIFIEKVSNTLNKPIHSKNNE
ncbi:MAG: ATP-binding cassette domain-containing protein [Bacteroidales bacterium]|nr:ATP-binding cassette domain-containing protein [Bacteroidales bacterium]